MCSHVMNVDIVSNQVKVYFVDCTVQVNMTMLPLIKAVENNFPNNFGIETDLIALNWL